MACRADSIRFAMWAEGDAWSVAITHVQDPSYGHAYSPSDQVVDNYDFLGDGPMTDQVSQEICSLLCELVAYSTERISGLQLALF